MKKIVNQADMVLDYLVRAKSNGATNFEMILALHILDVRKRISEINKDSLCKYHIASQYETNENTGVTYKRYYAVPKKMKLERFLNERKYVGNAKGKSKHSRKR